MLFAAWPIVKIEAMKQLLTLLFALFIYMSGTSQNNLDSRNSINEKDSPVELKVFPNPSFG